MKLIPRQSSLASPIYLSLIRATCHWCAQLWPAAFELRHLGETPPRGATKGEKKKVLGLRDKWRNTWKDLMKVQSSVRMPSPRLRSFTRRITRKSRKKVIEMREFSSAFWKPLAQRQELQQHGRNRGPGPQRMLRRELTALFLVLVLLPGLALPWHPRDGPRPVKPALSPMVVRLLYGGSRGHQPFPSGCLDSWGLGICYAINPSITSPPHIGKMQFSFDIVLEEKDTFSFDLSAMFYPSKCLSQQFWWIWCQASATCRLLCWKTVAGPRSAPGCETLWGHGVCCSLPSCWHHRHRWQPRCPCAAAAMLLGAGPWSLAPAALCSGLSHFSWPLCISHSLRTAFFLVFFFFKNILFWLHCYCSSVQYFKIVFLLACFFLTASALSLSIFPWACNQLWRSSAFTRVKATRIWALLRRQAYLGLGGGPAA